MTKKQFKMLFNKNIEAHIPTSVPVISWDEINFDTNQESMSLPNGKAKMRFFELKLVLSAVFVIMLVFAGFSLFNKEIQPAVNNPYVNLSYQNTLSVSAVSTATLMNNISETTVSTNQALSLVTQLSTYSSVTSIEPYLEMIETVTGQNFGIITENTASDLSSYESKVILKTTDLTGNLLVYTLYFNTTSYQQNENHTEFTIEGIFLYRSKQYDFIGQKKIDEDQEVLTFKTITNSSNYVESSFKTENDESKYYIKIVENGSIISQSTIKIEEDDGNKKIALKFLDGNNQGQYEFTYDQEDGKNILKIEYQTLIDNVEDSGKMKVEIKTDALTGFTIYQILVQPDDDDEYEYESDRRVDKDDERDDDDNHETDEEDHEDQEDEED